MIVGPGLIMAATGVGAGDFIAATVGGAKFGLALLWILVVGAVVKFLMTEGLARWQQTTGTTLVEGWCERLHPSIGWAFLVFLVGWSFIVGGGLASACGLAGHTIAPLADDAGVSIPAWGVIHMLVAAALVGFGRYAVFEKVMAALAGLMFVCVVTGAILTGPALVDVVRGAFIPGALPKGSTPDVLAAIGGVGGSVTILSYGYWLREAGRDRVAWRRATRIDLVVCYAMTGLFGICMMVMAAQVFYPAVNFGERTDVLVRLADALRADVGPVGYWIFAIGFWGGMFSSVIGVLAGVPYLFADTVSLVRRVPAERRAAYTDTRSWWYRGFLVYVALFPLVWLFRDKPVGMMRTYAIVSSFVTPFIGATLLVMNRRRDWMGEARYGVWMQLAMGACVLLFGYLCAKKLGLIA